METWTYIPADRRIVDENGLTIAHGVLPDDAPDMLAAPHVPALIDALRRAGGAMIMERDPTAPHTLAAVKWAELIDHMRATIRAARAPALAAKGDADPVCPRCGRPPSSYAPNTGDCIACRYRPIGDPDKAVPPAVDPLSIARDAMANALAAFAGDGVTQDTERLHLSMDAMREALKTLEGARAAAPLSIARDALSEVQDYLAELSGTQPAELPGVDRIHALITTALRAAEA